MLTGFDIKSKDDVAGDDDDPPVLKPIGPGTVAEKATIHTTCMKSSTV